MKEGKEAGEGEQGSQGGLPSFRLGVWLCQSQIRRCHRKRRKFGGREMKTPLIQAEEGREAPMEFGA